MFLYIYSVPDRDACLKAGLTMIADYGTVFVFVNDGKEIPDGVHYVCSDVVAL